MIGERGKWIWEDGTFKPYYEKKRELLVNEVITDEIEPTVSHATPEGKVFTSKSQLRRHYRANGFRETGGDHLKDAMRAPKVDPVEERKKDKEIIEQAYMDVKYGRVQFTEIEKEQHLREKRKCQVPLKAPY
jgi:hypothetical protein